MTNTYLTGNPLGSSAPKDLFDNASNFDEAMNSTSPSFDDRFGKRRQTWAGAEYEWQQFMQNFGFEPVPLVYVDGSSLTMSRPTQLITRGSSVYKIKLPVVGGFPVTLTGTWATDQGKLVDVGDASLRAALAASTGATLIGVTGYANLQANLDALAVITPERYGAVGDGATDDTAAVQAAINAAQDAGGFLLLRRKYRCTQTLNQTKRLVVQGQGSANSQIIYTGSGDAWVVTPPFAGASNTGYRWQDFGIVPAVAGSGQYGLRIRLQAATGGAVCFLADSRWWGLLIGDFGQQGLYLDNSVSNTDGFFTSQVEYCTVVNGIKGVKLGDSLTFGHNKLYGRNCGIDVTGVAGARQMIIEDNNITTHGGLVALQDVEEPTLRDNQLEHPGYLSGYTGVYDAGVLLYNCFKPRIEGNTINPDNGAATAPSNPGIASNTIALTGTTSDAYITQNDIQKGAVSHIAIGNTGVLRTRIDELNTYYGAQPVISDGGIDTIFPTVRATFPYAATISNATVAGQDIVTLGARVGQFVEVTYTAGPQGVELRGWVVAAGTVRVRIENNTGAAVTLAGGSLSVKVSS